jgi:hypothetical protein
LSIDSILLQAFFFCGTFFLLGLANLRYADALLKRPDARIIEDLVFLLFESETRRLDWNALTFKQQIINTLEDIATRFEQDLANQLRPADEVTELWWNRAMLKTAASLRSLKTWALLPRADTRDHFIATLSAFFVHFARGEWDSLPQAERELPPLKTRLAIRVKAFLVSVFVGLAPLGVLWSLRKIAMPVPESLMGTMTAIATVWAMVILLTALSPGQAGSVAEIVKLFFQLLPIPGRKNS